MNSGSLRSFLSLRPSFVRLPPSVVPLRILSTSCHHHPFAVSLFMRSPNQTLIRRPEMNMSVAASSPNNDGKDKEQEFWVMGLDDPLLADLITKKRKYVSAVLARLNVEAAIRKLGARVSELGSLWTKLIAESKTLNKLKREYVDSRLNYVIHRVEKGMSEEDFEEKLYRTIMDYDAQGQMYTEVVAEWVMKYGARLFEVDDADTDAT